jgi:hypothetical protein
MTISRGEIWLVNLDPTVGDEIRKMRPAIVVSRDASTYLESRRREGYELHARIADPKFVDPAKDDYRLQPDSPAIELGFQPIDIGQIGPRARASRKEPPVTEPAG